MLNREIYLGDYTNLYYAKVSQNDFIEDISKNQLDLFVIKSEESKYIEWLNYVQGLTYTVTLAGSLGAVLLFRRIPLLNRIQNRWAVFSTKVALFFLPSLIVYGQVEAKKQQVVWDIYIKNFDKYKKYKQTGNIKALDEQIRVV